MQTALTSFERELAKALRAGRVRLEDAGESRRPSVATSGFRMSADRAEPNRRRVRQLVDDLETEPDDADGVPVHVLFSLYRVDE